MKFSTSIIEDLLKGLYGGDCVLEGCCHGNKLIRTWLTFRLLPAILRISFGELFPNLTSCMVLTKSFDLHI